MVLIPSGEFQMGSHRTSVGWANSYLAAEAPIHTVYLDAFYMDKYEVTNAQYKEFQDATGYVTTYKKSMDSLGFTTAEHLEYGNNPDFKAPDQPVVMVSWHDAKAYCDWAGKRLPTEAEWEKAARGGLVGKKYPWGDDAPDLSLCNFDEMNFKGFLCTSSVGHFPPNGYGLYDMAGNAAEWCTDWYNESYYERSPKKNPKGPRSGSQRVIRGGSWSNPYASYASGLRTLRVTSRSYSGPATWCFTIGFRCAKDVLRD